MPNVDIVNETLKIELTGSEKFAAVSGNLSFPIAHVTAVRVDEDIVEHLGLRAPGAHLPGLLAAGTYFYDGDRQFVYWHHDEIPVVIELTDEKYDRIILGVPGTQADAAALVARISKG